MTKFVTVRRRYLLAGVGVAAVVLVAIFSLLGTSLSPIVPSAVAVQAELKIVSVDFDPRTVEREVVYGGESLKGVKVLGTSSFKVSAVVQNVTEKSFTNVPVKLTLNLYNQPDQQVVKQGSIPSLEPGATARITFENLQALGDAGGVQADLGKHDLIIHLGGNAEGGLGQETEAKVSFLVDTTQK